MRTTIILDDDLVMQARKLSGIERITDLVKSGLVSLIAQEARKRVISFGGTDPKAKAGPRGYVIPDETLYAAEKTEGEP